uniref:Tripartite motif-containing protein 16-like n=1 Tax=Erpetoichthys calabaricus TaxID=27687 RepID=A0A8C4T4U9_ERPCA
MISEDLVFVSQDEFTCSVCLSPLTDPITIPCGHSFCLQCLSRASKSCLTCMISYCHAHLQPHFEIVAWKDHKLTDPDVNLKEKICAKHHQSLNMFCKTDDMCICMVCVVNEHNGHTMVELEPETEEKQVKGGLISMENEVEEHEKSLTDLICCIEETRRKLMERFRERERMEMEKVEEILSNQITVHSTHLSLVSAAPDWFLLIVCAVPRPPVPLHTHRFFCLLADFCPLTLDINTTNKHLHLSEGNKKVTRKETEIKYPDHPDRFEWCPQVLCREALTGTRCYWEVECSGCCMRIGVTYEGLGRNECYWQCGLGENEESWCLICSNNSYHSVQHNDVQTEVDTPYSPRLGVYLDWPAGSLSFYSVSHTMTLLHRLNTSFTKPLYPGFWLGMDASITICPLMMSCDH